MLCILAISDLAFNTQCNSLFTDLYFSVNNKKKLFGTNFPCFLFFGRMYPSLSVITGFVSYKTWPYILLFMTSQL